MSNRSALPPGIVIRHAASGDELSACFPVIAQLRPYLRDAADWVARASAMAPAGYRVLAVWEGERVSALAGYRVTENLIHGRFLYVDDLVATADRRGSGLGAALLQELSIVGVGENCRRLVLDTAATNTNAQRFYKREGLVDSAIGFMKPLEQLA
ncbi:MAG TPA: GNAT family N-acetyltransferase [Dongiaceae bacterium]|jgi:ribosomal protein S18 acetylase RimI-like enzyme|nr:GNAT family N-acetyltransferase [Dongiaceae bacterium]